MFFMDGEGSLALCSVEVKAAGMNPGHIGLKNRWLLQGCTLDGK